MFTNQVCAYDEETQDCFFAVYLEFKMNHMLNYSVEYLQVKLFSAQCFFFVFVADALFSLFSTVIITIYNSLPMFCLHGIFNFNYFY